tara:strand:+ start:2728 stop:3864 length:1137 start_codon:yes stop_codon:yes gene_type:complete
MASNVEEDYDSDTELVPDYDMVDLNDFKLTKGDELAGGSWELPVEHKRDDTLCLQFALPVFRIGDSVDIQTASKNGFFRVQLDDSNTKHSDYKQFINKLEVWLVSQIVNNHDKWFGYMWQTGGPLEGYTRPSPSAIKNMYHPMIGDDNIFCSRVHIRKGNYQLQCMDTDQNMISIESIQNCNVVPLVEVKGVFMKPHGYNPDIVLRGLVKIPPATKTTTPNNDDFRLFHTTDKDDSYAYYDYATEDEDTDCEETIIPITPVETKNIEIPDSSLKSTQATQETQETQETQATQETQETQETQATQETVPVAVSPDEVTASTNTDKEEQKEASKPENNEHSKEIDNETLQALMLAAEEAKLKAAAAADEYQKYMTQQGSV